MLAAKEVEVDVAVRAARRSNLFFNCLGLALNLDRSGDFELNFILFHDTTRLCCSRACVTIVFVLYISIICKDFNKLKLAISCGKYFLIGLVGFRLRHYPMKVALYQEWKFVETLVCATLTIC